METQTNEDRAYARLVAKAKASAIGFAALAAVLGATVLIVRPEPAKAAVDDIGVVADMDTRYQLAVKQNDAATMDRILHDDFVWYSATAAPTTNNTYSKTLATRSTSTSCRT